jgi:hypothetical protein
MNTMARNARSVSLLTSRPEKRIGWSEGRPSAWSMPEARYGGGGWLQLVAHGEVVCLWLRHLSGNTNKSDRGMIGLDGD